MGQRNIILFLSLFLSYQLFSKKLRNQLLSFNEPWNI